MSRPLLLTLSSALVLAGCGGFPGPASPAAVAYRPATAADAGAWAVESRPEGNTLLRFKWLYREERSSVGGSGSVRISAPDSLRLDFRAPLGSGRGAAAVVDNRALWADPQEEVDKFVPNFQLLWAMLGVALAPQPGSTVLTVDDGRVTAWRYVDGADTVDYLRTRSAAPQLLTDVRSAGKRIGRALTTFDASGRPSKVRLDVPSGPARLDITFTEISSPAAHPAGTWDAPVLDR